MLENVHLEASVAVHDDMLEHSKFVAIDKPRVGTGLEGLQLWVSHFGAPLIILKGL